MAPLCRRDFLKASAVFLLTLYGHGRGRAETSPSSPLRGKARTVLGDISPPELGVTLMHEHLLMEHPRLPRDHFLMIPILPPANSPSSQRLVPGDQESERLLS